MLCQICNKRIATKFVKINGCDTDICETCATNFNLFSPPSVTDFFDMIFDIENYMDDAREERVCPNCGLSESQLTGGYKFGCSRCYDVFADRADEYFRQLRGVEYRGRFAGSGGSRPRPRYLKDATYEDIPHLYKMLENPSIKSDSAKVNLIIGKIKELKGER